MPINLDKLYSNYTAMPSLDKRQDAKPPNLSSPTAAVCYC